MKEEYKSGSGPFNQNSNMNGVYNEECKNGFRKLDAQEIAAVSGGNDGD
jgi:hypothetical protein